MNEVYEYPKTIDRLKAIMIDGFVLIVFMFAFTYLFEFIGAVPDLARMIALLFTFLLYDPLFTSIFGGTIGHMAIGLRVKRESDTSRNIIFPLALLRYLVKIFLGWISLLTVASHPKAKAMHDMLVGSVVIFHKNPPSSVGVADTVLNEDV